VDQKRLTLVRDKGKEIPALVLESAILNCGAAISVAYAHADNGTPVVEIFQSSLRDVDHAEGALGFVKDILEETKDHKIVVHFSAIEDDQPYVILNNEAKEPTLVAFMIGDFSEHDGKGKVPEAVEAETYLTPKILELYEHAEDDIPKLLGKLKEPTVTRDLNKMGSGDFLNCTLLASNGELLGFCRPKSPPIRYDWGSASGDLDEHKAAAPPPKPAAAPDPKSMTLAERLAAKKKAKAEGAEPPPPPAEPKKEKVTEVSPGQHVIEPATGKPMESLADRLKAKKEAKEGTLPATLHVVGIPPVFDKAKNRRKWFSQRGMTGEVNIDFPDFQTRTNPILVPLAKLQACHGKLTVEEITKKFPIATPEELKKYSGTQPAPTQEQKTETSTSVPATPPKADVVVISAAHRQNLKEKFLSKPKIVALVDKKGNSTDDPAFLPAMEDKGSSWTEAIGLKDIHAADWWKKEEYRDMGSYSLDTLASAAFDYKMLWLKSESQLAKLKGGALPNSAAGVGGTETKSSTLAERLAAKKAAKAA